MIASAWHMVASIYIAVVILYYLRLFYHISHRHFLPSSDRNKS